MDSILTGRRGGLIKRGLFCACAFAQAPCIDPESNEGHRRGGGGWNLALGGAAPPSVLLSLSRLRPSVRGRRTAAATGGGRSLFLRLGGFVFGGGDDGQNIPSSLAPSSFSAATPRPSLVPHSSPTLST